MITVYISNQVCNREMVRKFMPGGVERSLHVLDVEPMVPDGKSPMSDDRGMRLKGQVKRAIDR